MKKKIKDKWVNVLRSRKYKQADGALKIIDENGKETHCCLGVLCDLYINSEAGKKNKARWTEKTPNVYGYGYESSFVSKTCDGEQSMLPAEVRDWAGLDSEDPEIAPNSKKNGNCASEQNDSGVKFNKIANFIEKNL